MPRQNEQSSGCFSYLIIGETAVAPLSSIIYFAQQPHTHTIASFDSLAAYLLITINQLCFVSSALALGLFTTTTTNGRSITWNSCFLFVSFRFSSSKLLSNKDQVVARVPVVGCTMLYVFPSPLETLEAGK